MTRDQADYAIVHLRRAIDELSREGTRTCTLQERGETAKIDIEKALALITDLDTVASDPQVIFDPYADQSLRPGLNKPLEDSANV